MWVNNRENGPRQQTAKKSADSFVRGGGNNRLARTLLFFVCLVPTDDDSDCSIMFREYIITFAIQTLRVLKNSKSLKFLPKIWNGDFWQSRLLGGGERSQKKNPLGTQLWMMSCFFEEE